MPESEELVRAIKAVMIKVWRLPAEINDGEIEKYAADLFARIEADESRYALDLQARDIQVNWLRQPLNPDYKEVVDWALALVRRAREGEDLSQGPAIGAGEA